MDDAKSARPVRVAVWGLGLHARRRILPAIAACSRTVLAGVSSRNAEVVSQEAGKLACRAWPNPSAMLESREVDAVYLATPIGLHHAQGMEVLAAGKHLWCEKSLTSRLAETSELAALSRRKKRALCEAFMFAYHPQFLRIMELTSLTLGRVTSITSRFGMPVLEEPGFRHSRELGGGALLDLACYPLSLALRMTGEDASVTVKTSRSAPGIDVDVAGHALLEFPSGTTAYLEWGFGPAYTNEVRVWAEHGSLYADHIFSKPDGFEASIELDDVRGARRTEALPATDAFVRMLDVFARAAEDEELQERLRQEAERQARHLAALTVS